MYKLWELILFVQRACNSFSILQKTSGMKRGDVGWSGIEKALEETKLFEPSAREGRQTAAMGRVHTSKECVQLDSASHRGTIISFYDFVDNPLISFLLWMTSSILSDGSLADGFAPFPVWYPAYHIIFTCFLQSILPGRTALLCKNTFNWGILCSSQWEIRQ